MNDPFTKTSKNHADISKKHVTQENKKTIIEDLVNDVQNSPSGLSVVHADTFFMIAILYFHIQWVIIYSKWLL